MYAYGLKFIDGLLKIMKILWILTGASMVVPCGIILFVFFEIVVLKNHKFEDSALGRRGCFITPSLAISVMLGCFALVFSVIYIIAIIINYIVFLVS